MTSAPTAAASAYALSSQQQRAADTAAPGVRCVLVAELDGAGPADLPARVAEALWRHEVLRSAFPRVPGRSNGVAVPDPEPGAPDVAIVTAAGEDVLAEGRALARRIELRPEEGRPLGVALVRGGRRCALVLAASPLAADVRSLAVLAGELLGAPAAEPVRYAGYAAWQRREQQGDEARAWREELGSTDLAITDLLGVGLPAMDPRARRGGRATAAVADVPDGLTGAEVLAGWAILLGRVAGTDRLVIVTNDDGRRVDGLERAVGPYEASMPIVLDIDERMPASDLLARVAAGREAIAGRAHLWDWQYLDGSRGARTPPFGFVSVQPPATPAGTTRVEVAPAAPDCLLAAVLVERAGGPLVELSFDERAVRPAYATLLARQFGALLRTLRAHGDGAIRDLVLEGDSIARGGVPADAPELAHERIRRWASEEPARPAVSDDAGTLSFAELVDEADALAARLRAAGCRAGSCVATVVARNRHYPVAALAAAGIGAVFVPFDPVHSIARLQQARSDGLVTVVVAERATAHLVAGDEPVVLLDAPGTPGRQREPGADPRPAHDDPCYALYTSGSTGRPRPVAVTYGSLAHYAAALPRAIGLEPSDRFVHTAALGFSSSLRQTVVALAAGAEVVIATEDELASPPALVRRAIASGATVLDLVPSLWRRVIAAAGQDARLRTDLQGRLRLLLSASEPLTAGVAAGMLDLTDGAEVVNMYGQTETAGIVAAATLTRADLDADVAPLGRPLPGVDVVILDGERRVLPTGFSGFVHVGGPPVPSGAPPAWSDGLADRLVVATLAGRVTTLYDTGDVGYLDERGVLRLRGRRDGQVKVRGFRVELGEVEASLARHPAVQDAVVVAAAGPGGDTALAAYVVPQLDQRPTHVDLASFLAQRVPGYLIPASVKLLTQLPRNANGKVDRQALAAGGTPGAAVSTPYVEPRSDTERALAAILAGVLGLERVGATDNIFDLGTNSLLGIDVMNRVNGELGIAVPWTTIFANPTVERLAASLDHQAGAAAEEGWTEASL
jgi:amino acid adenylation domain-containing protein